MLVLLLLVVLLPTATATAYCVDITICCTCQDGDEDEQEEFPSTAKPLESQVPQNNGLPWPQTEAKLFKIVTYSRKVAEEGG